MDEEMKAAYEAMFVGNKAKMRPVADALLDAVNALGNDVTVSVSHQYVAMAKGENQFGIFSPASGRRVTLRLRLLGTVPPGDRLESTAQRNPEGRFDMVAYLKHPAMVDDEVRTALRKALKLAG